MDISAFLAMAEGWDDIKLKPLPYKIAVHEPCSLRNVLRGATHPYKLLARIPEAQVVPLAGNNQCCGAAGTYFADQPEMAQVLLHDKLCRAACQWRALSCHLERRLRDAYRQRVARNEARAE